MCLLYVYVYECALHMFVLMHVTYIQVVTYIVYLLTYFTYIAHT